MKYYFTKLKAFTRQFKELVNISYSASDALGVSEGEFWVWYGNPFILQCKPKK